MLLPSAEEGWRDSLIEAGAPGAEREPDRAKPQLMVSSAKRYAGLTTPSAPSAHPPLLCEEGNPSFGFDKLRRVNTADSRYIYTCRR